MALLYILGLIGTWVMVAKLLSRFSGSRIVSIGGGFLILIIGIGVINGIVESIANHEALERAADAGFSTIEEFESARAQGFSTKDALDSRKKARADAQRRRQIVEQQERAREKREKEKECRKSLRCWGDHNLFRAAFACNDLIERLAKYDYKWTDGIFESKFSQFRWKDSSHHVITYIGDTIKFQNGFGAWQYYTYECDYDPEARRIVDVRASAGRLP